MKKARADRPELKSGHVALSFTTALAGDTVAPARNLSEHYLIQQKCVSARFLVLAPLQQTRDGDQRISEPQFNSYGFVLIAEGSNGKK